MTYEDYWAEVEKLKVLPAMAIRQLPAALKVDTKKKLMMLKTEETAEVLRDAIEQVNRGSVESIDSLIKKKAEIG